MLLTSTSSVFAEEKFITCNKQKDDVCHNALEGSFKI